MSRGSILDFSSLGFGCIWELAHTQNGPPALNITRGPHDLTEWKFSLIIAGNWVAEGTLVKADWGDGSVTLSRLSTNTTPHRTGGLVGNRQNMVSDERRDRSWK